uniref:Uncharacterized protein n=1 Tax=Romanomermis culicivorax TaxID=13658 RepID=A0A915KQV3_ROMCU
MVFERIRNVLNVLKILDFALIKVMYTPMILPEIDINVHEPIRNKQIPILTK